MFRLTSLALPVIGCITIAGCESVGVGSPSEVDYPAPMDAKLAAAEIFEGETMLRVIAGDFRLGTCIPTPYAARKVSGSATCTFASSSGGEVIESRAEFYKTGDKWRARPSAVKDELPYPDPALKS